MSPAHDTDDATPQRSPSTPESHRSIQVDTLHSNLSLHRLKNPAKETDTNDSSRGASISTATDHASDVASVRSKRTGDVPESPPAGTTAAALASQPPAPTVRPVAQQSPASARQDDDLSTQPQRRTRHRSVIEVRSGAAVELLHVDRRRLAALQSSLRFFHKPYSSTRESPGVDVPRPYPRGSS